jgi:ferredoxin
MATVITEACINCGACEPECPNTAIYQGGVEWELDGAKHAAISDSIFYIVPEKCTECVGFYDHEACAAVCPVDCCIPDPKIPETEAVLLERAKKLHPDQDFGPDFPSRFKEKKEEAPTAPAEAAAPAAAAPEAPVSTEAGFALAIPSAEEWELTLVCHRCQGEYAVEFQYFRPGTVFYCPHCGGSFVPTVEIYEQIAGPLERFHAEWAAEFESFRAKRARELEAFETRQRNRLIEFDRELRAKMKGLKPPGAPAKRKGIFG